MHTKSAKNYINKSIHPVSKVVWHSILAYLYFAPTYNKPEPPNTVTSQTLLKRMKSPSRRMWMW